MKKITRMVKITRAEVMQVITESNETATATVEVHGTFKDKEKLLTAIKKSYDNDAIKNVHVLSSEEDEILYGMPVDDFIRCAQVMDKEKYRKKKEEKEYQAFTSQE